MKKLFVFCGIISCLYGTNGYAVGSQDVSVVFICPDGCGVAYVDMQSCDGCPWVTRTRCFFQNGDDCGDPQVHVFENSTALKPQSDIIQQSIKTSKTLKSTRNKSDKVSSRAAKIGKNVNTADIPSTPMGAKEKASVGSGETIITCYDDCKLDCSPNPYGTEITCRCKKPNGEICQESVDIFQPESHK